MGIRPWIIVVIAMVSLSVGGCSMNDESFIEKLQKGIPSDLHSEEILHVEMIGNGLLVFFRSNSELGVGIFKQQSKSWKWMTGSGFANLSPNAGLSVHHSNRDEISLYLSYGVITDRDIFEIQSLNEKAKIIQIPDGMRIWFITYENSIGQDGSIPAITGLSKDGELIVAIP